MPDTTQFQTTLDDQVVQSMVNLILVIAAGFAVYVGGTLLLWAIRHRRARHVDELLHAVTHNPPLIPAHEFDASDTTPTLPLPTLAAARVCRICAMQLAYAGEITARPDPDETLTFCVNHAYTTLARALERQEIAR